MVINVNLIVKIHLMTIQNGRWIKETRDQKKGNANGRTSVLGGKYFSEIFDLGIMSIFV